MSETPYRYTAEMAGRIETGWQDRWEELGTFRAPNPAGPWAEPERVQQHEGHQLILDMFPYPSGAGLHVGHPLGYIATDVYARYQRMLGKNVLHCLGYDAFGLPAEQFAVQTGQHPRVTTEANMETMRRQLRRLGLGHDDRRAFATIDPDYYRWTQWIFLQIFNAWYDEDAVRPDGGRGRARPIAELVEAFASGERPLPEGEIRTWADLSPKERSDVLDGYRLAYSAEAPVNWAPGLGSVVANEEVTSDGRSERGNFPVFRTNLRQWMMRITAYADRLADDLDRVEWPDKVKAMQRNWIGRSEGAQVTFTATGTDGAEHPIEVFTTRPDTLFGATFMVLAPEHPLVDTLVPEGGWPEGTLDAWTGGADTPFAAVSAYREEARRKSDVERQIETKDKTGVFTGGWATNPVSGARIPVFVADYVLMGYGTGAIMAVPSGDQRDFDYATAFGLDIIPTVAAPEGHEGAWSGDGEIINSVSDSISLDGLTVAEGKAAITTWLEEHGVGRGTVNYKLRDWLFSRQRYWGEPFPIVFDDDGVAHAVPESMLPVELPEVDDYSPRTFDPDDASSQPEPPLGRATEWVEVELDLGDGPRRYRRETNTMPNWAGSCWYYLRYLDPANDEALVDPANEAYWVGPRETPVPGAPAGTRDPGGVDLYIGGVEHAVLHLLYARFWHKILFDLGHVSSEEPFRRYFSQGYIQAHAYRDDRGQPVPAAEVVEDASAPTGFTWQGQPVTQEYGKIGKSLKNAVSPDEMYEQYGADTFRVYEMSLGPLEQSKPWETRAVVGSQRFLQRLWRNVVDEETGEVRVTDGALDAQTERLLHQTIAAVGADYASLGFNTAIARLIELNNALTKLGEVPRAAVEPLVLMVAPIAPHLAEELWSRLGHEHSLSAEHFPVADESKMVEASVTCVIQIKGKVRDRVEVPSDIGEDELRELALGRDKIKAATEGGIRTVIVRAPKLVNVVPA
ncbi:leucine--tRNA ligase [Janibacter hoylei]|uniref:leucine--tRNA ligase n=1 Tax=Janibacter hoylei TaxID=364298 RepID=UPI0021A624CC|nr:leucine--tRNA ligase [Janibacter hoylei]MCT1618616.1 leucine--tRNA ligase [Janibacter hoylei]MCT2291907.1 leucine--tRNA ligase [Janibacter hoylei]